MDERVGEIRRVLYEVIMISACVITKNEEKNLPRWCKCARALADELIVVDTGSTDYTVAIATAAKATVFSFEWRDDFSAAKNYAISKAHGDWIVFLDADEYIPPEDIPTVKEYLTTADENIAGLACRWINIDADNGDKILNEGVQLRIFRNHPDIKYYGRVHETILTSGSWSAAFADGVRIYHTGYSMNLIRAKSERNLKLLLAEQKRRGERWPDAFYLADCYYALGNYKEAIQQARNALVCGRMLPNFEGRMESIIKASETLISSSHQANKN